MIEVEKNYDISPEGKKRMIEGATLLYKKVLTDTYYDSNDYSLTGRDFWLRKRNGKFELKVPLNSGKILDRVTDQYKELEADAEIARELGLPSSHDLSETIEKAGFAPFGTIITTRESYQKNDFHLDFDEIDFGFTAFEIELMVEKIEDIPNAEKKILDFATKYNVSATGKGKVIEFLRRYRPKHFAFLESKRVA
ncbi:MAG: CYTH domain-containing protein [Candidatus Taylorbacteria bacterium]|nr:CYTH domain-containing protein [Candidatus Taylorbacteria bacterium]